MAFLKRSSGARRRGRSRKKQRFWRGPGPSRQEELKFDWQVTELEQRLLFAADVMADFNNDTFLDEAQLDAATESISLRLGSPTGFGQPNEVISLVGKSPTAIVSGRFAGNDQSLDLAVANAGTNEISIYTGNEDGTFALDRTLSFDPSEGLPDFSSLVAGDFDGNGLTDIAMLGADIGETQFPTLEAVEPLGSLIYRGSVHGAIGLGGDTDTYTIDLQAGRSLTIVVTPGDTLTPIIEITSPGELGPLESHVGADGQVVRSFRTPADGTYTITISGGANNTSGTFDLDLILNSAVELEEHGGATNDILAVLPGTAQDIEGSFLSLGGNSSRGAVLGRIDELPDGSLDTDYFQFQLKVGDTLGLAVTDSFPGFPALNLALTDASGTVLTSDNQGSYYIDASITAFVADAEGTYLVRVAGFTNTDYSLIVTKNSAFEIEQNDQVNNAQNLTWTGVALGSLDVHDFSNPIGDSFEAEPNDDGIGFISAADLPFANHLAFQPIGLTQYRASLVGALQNNSSLDFYRFNAAPGEMLEVALNSISIDPFVYLIDRNAFILAADDDSGEGFDALLTYDGFSYSGEYYIVATQFGSANGSYELEATIDLATASDFYDISVLSGNSLVIEASAAYNGQVALSDLLQAEIELYGPDFARLPVSSTFSSSSGVARLEWAAVTTGIYRVRVLAGAGSAAGEYTLTVKNATGNQLLSLPQIEPFDREIKHGTVDGVIADSLQSIHRIAVLEAGQRLTLVIDVEQASQLTPQLEIFDPLGNPLPISPRVGPDGDLILQQLPISVTGTYELVFSGEGTGAFSAVVIVNAAAEEELSTQPIDSYFVGGGVSKTAAIVGALDGAKQFETTLTRFDRFTQDNAVVFNFTEVNAPQAIGGGTLTITAVGMLEGAELVIDDLTLIIRNSEIIENGIDGSLRWTTSIDPTTLAKIVAGAQISLTARQPGSNSSAQLNGVMMTLSYEVAADVSDTYRFTVEAGETVSVLVTPWFGATTDVWLKDAAGNYLAAGDKIDPFHVQIDGFRNTIASTQPTEFVLIVTGDLDANYSLFVTKNDAETEGSAQQLPVSDIVTGVVGEETIRHRLFGVVHDFDGIFITEFDRFTGAELNRFPVPESSGNGWDGLAYNGTNLFFITGFAVSNVATLFEIDPDTGGVIRSLPISSDGPIDALAFVDGLIAARQLHNNQVYTGDVFFLDPANGSVVRTWTSPFSFDLTGMAGATSRSSVFVSNGDQLIFELDASTGQPVRNEPIFVPAQIGGLAFLDGQLYVGSPSGEILVVDPDSGVVSNVFAPSGFRYIVALGGDDNISQTFIDTDSYRFHADVDDTLTITVTPLPSDPANDLLPNVEVLDPFGIPVQLSSPGINSFRFTAEVAGEYIVHISAADGTSGSYRLSVDGRPFLVAPHTGFQKSITYQTRPGTIIDIPYVFTDDIDFLAGIPDEITVTFAEGVRLDRLVPGALMVDGEEASSFRIVDGNTVAFRLGAPLAEGAHTMLLRGVVGGVDAVVDFQGVALRDFTREFDINLSLRVVDSSILEGDTVPAGSLTYTATFDGPLSESDLNAFDVTLFGSSSAFNIFPTNFTYDAGTFTVTIEYGNLPEDEYILTLHSGDGAFENRALVDLDGEPHPLTTVPSGDGTPGGNFVVHFSADVLTVPFPTPLTSIAPVGSLIQTGSVEGFISTDDSGDTYTITLGADQTLAALVTPIVTTGGATLRPRLTITTPSMTSVTVDAANVGDHVYLFQPTEEPGTYQVTVSGGPDGTAGEFELELFLNAALELEQLGGPSNDQFNSPQNLDETFISTITGERGAVLGDGNAGVVAVPLFSANFENGADGFVVNNSTPSGNGLWHRTITGRVGDGDPNHSPPASFYFGRFEGPLGGGNYDTGRRGGTITSPTISLPTGEVISLTFNSLIELEPGSAWDQISVVVIDGSNRTTVLTKGIITEWGQPFPDTTLGAWLPFEANLSQWAGRSIRIEFRFDTIDSTANDFEGWYIDDIVVSRVTPDSSAAPDWYSFTLGDGQAATLVSAPLQQSALSLELYNSSGARVATAIGSADGSHRTSAYVDPADGSSATYFARVLATGEYSLVVNTGEVPVTLPIQLTDGTGYLWDISDFGIIADGSNNVYANGMLHSSFASSTAFAEGGREVIIGPQQSGSFQLARKIYVPEGADEGFARYLEFVTNTSSSQATYTMTVVTNFTTAPSFISTSSGDAIATTADDWLITDDANGSGSPTMLHLFAGPGGLQRPTLVQQTGVMIVFRYVLTLQPGETQIIMHFASQNDNQSTAAARVSELWSPQPSALAGMTQAELSLVRNFQLGAASFASAGAPDPDNLSAGYFANIADSDSLATSAGYFQRNNVFPAIAPNFLSGDVLPTSALEYAGDPFASRSIVQQASQLVALGSAKPQRELFIYLQNASGEFDQANPIRIATELVGSVTLLTEDFNADWGMDVVVAGTETTSTRIQTVSITEGTVDRIRKSPHQDFSLAGQLPISAGDFNNDGALDLALPGGSEFLRGLGTGAFTRQAGVILPVASAKVVIDDQLLSEDFDPLFHVVTFDPSVLNPLININAWSNVPSLFASITPGLNDTGTAHTLTLIPEAHQSGIATITIVNPEDPAIVLGQFRVIVRAEADLPNLVVPRLITLPPDNTIIFDQAELIDVDGSEELQLQVTGVENTIEKVNDTTFKITVVSPSRDFSLNVTAIAVEKSTGQQVSTSTEITVVDAGHMPGLETIVPLSAAPTRLTGFIALEDRDVFKLTGLNGGDVLEIVTSRVDGSTTDEQFNPVVRFFVLDSNGKHELHDGPSFLSNTFRVPVAGEYFDGQYFLDVVAPNETLQGNYEITLERVSSADTIIVPVRNTGFSFVANPAASYLLKLDDPRVYAVSAIGATLRVIAGQPGANAENFATTAGIPVQVALDDNGVYFLCVDAASMIRIDPVLDVANSPLSAAALSIHTPVKLNSVPTSSEDWYQVRLSAGSNISIERQDGLRFFISDSGNAADTKEIIPPVSDDSQGNFLISAVSKSTLFIQVGSSSAVDSGTFVVQSADKFAVGQQPSAITAINALTGEYLDFNNNQIWDLVVVNKLSDSISILLGVGDGTFKPESVISLRGLTGHATESFLRPVAVVAADFDGDGDVDLATANSLSNDVSILLNNGDGTFGLPDTPFPTILVGDGPAAITAGHINQDGIIDLAVANYNSSTVNVLLGIGDEDGNGTGEFAQIGGAPLGFGVGAKPIAIVTGMFNGDNYVDLATANGTSISILLGSANERLPLEYRHSIIHSATSSVNLSNLFVIHANPGDDTFLDLLVLANNGQLNWLEQASDTGSSGELIRAGYFLAPTAGPSVAGFVAVALGDIDGDGVRDLIFRSEAPIEPIDGNTGAPIDGNTGLYEIRTLLGSDDGIFAAPLRAANTPRSVVRLTLTNPEVGGLSVAFSSLNTDTTVPNSDTDPDVVFLDTATGFARPYIGDGEGGLRTFGTPAESGVEAVVTQPATELDFPELLFIQNPITEQAATIAPQLATAQSIGGSGGGAGGTGELPGDDVELGLEFDDALPETQLETVASAAVDVLQVDESAFNAPADPKNVESLGEPTDVLAGDGVASNPIKPQGDNPQNGRSAVSAQNAAATPNTVLAETNDANYAGWIAAAVSLLIAPVIYWIAKTKSIRARKP